MADNLQILGKTYTNVAGIKAVNGNGDTLTFVKGEGGGSSDIVLKSGSFTPSERVSSITFDCGLSDINVMIIIPHNETPLKSGGKTFVGGIYTKSNYYKYICDTTNNAGSALLTPQADTSNSAFVMDGTNVTVYSYHTRTPSINVGAFEAITYDWFAW